MKLKPCIKFSLMLLVWSMFFSVKWVFTAGLAFVLHELGHMAMCLALGIKVLGIRALPWGISASTPLMYEPYVQIAVSLAGPVVNFLLLALSPAWSIFASPEICEVFALANLSAGLFNLIPVLPLDGGVILKAILCSKKGLIRGFSFMIRLTSALGSALVLFGIHILIITQGNFSYLVAGLFVLCNLRHERELSLCLKKRLLTGEMHSKPRTSCMTVDSDSNAVCLIDLISPSRTTEFRVFKDGVLMGTVSQERIIDCVLKNTMITVGECIEKS